MTIGFDDDNVRDATIRRCRACGHFWRIENDDDPCPICEPVDDNLGAAAWLLVPIFGLALAVVGVIAFIGTWLYRALT